VSWSQPLGPARPRPPRAHDGSVAFFDLDKTIIATNSVVALSRPFLAGGLLTKRAMIRSALAQVMYLLGSADAEQTERLRVQMSRLVAGWDVSLVRQIIDASLRASIEASVYTQAVALIAEHQAAGRPVVIVSASTHEIVEPMGVALGVEHVIATKMEIVDGRYTGEIDFYCYGENKATAMKQLADTMQWSMETSYAYSDSITDQPMLDAVGHGIAVNPDRTLRKVAAEHGWETVTFQATTGLRSMLPRPRRAAVVIAVVAGVLGTAAAATLMRRRRR